MAQAYNNPDREHDPHALPDIEVFYDDADLAYGVARNFDSEGKPVQAGWYWWACFPGCLPDGDPIGSYETEADALAAARVDMED